jgi:hypothetical protein
MKRTLLLLISCSFFISATQAQQIVENSERPLSPKSRRSISLKEVLRITEEGDAFYFQRPDLLRVGLDGSIFVKDRDQLLQFGSNGKLIRNYFKKGQGPGELNFVSDFTVYDKGLIVHNGYPSKIVWFDLTGKIIKDFSVRISGGSLQFLGFHDDAYTFLKSPGVMLNTIVGMEAFVDQPHTIVSVAEGLEGSRESGAFPTQVFIKKSKGGGAAIIPLNKIMSVPYQEKYILVSHTPEYSIKVMDLEKRETLRTFKRKYARVKTRPEDRKGISGGAMIDGRSVIAPASEFTADVVNLFVHDKDVWVATSTQSKEQGVLIDVFDFDGVYRDSFYIPLPEAPDRNIARPAPQVVMGDYFFAIEKDAEGIYMIKKYKIGG